MSETSNTATLTKQQYLSQRARINAQQAVLNVDLQILQADYIAANCELKEGQKVEYTTTTYYSGCEPAKAIERAVFTGECDISGQGDIMYQFRQDNGGGMILLERNLFEVVS